MKCKSWVEISKEALMHNVRVFRNHVDKKTALMAVVKSNAYGHGLVEVATSIKKEVDWFAVDSVDEGIALRAADVGHPILVLGYTLKNRLCDLIEHNLSFVVYDMDIVQELAVFTDVGHPIKVHIKIETGTVRQGVEGEDLRELVREISKHDHIEVEGAYTHFANVEEDEEFAKKQLERFRAALDVLEEEGVKPPILHAACSAAALTLHESHFDLIRLGISLYGLWSLSRAKSDILRRTRVVELKPVLTWKTVVAQVKLVKEGTPVGYGLTEAVKRDSKIAVLPIGYWDGFDRKLSGKCEVLVGGKRCKIVGRICMNMCMVDVTDVVKVRVEDEVVLIGEQGREEITAEEMAEKVGTINYEIVTRINSKIPRVLV